MADVKFKITVIGDAAVGKTSLIKKYTKGEFQRNYISTLGTQFTRHEEVIEGVAIELILWDIAGQAAFEVMRQNFYTGSSGAIIVFSHSPNETKSFNNIDKWLSEVREHCGNVQIALFGNKIDLISEEELQSTALCDSNVEGYVKSHNFLGYYKTSALTGEGVYEAFYALAKRLHSLKNY
ncbi:MAG: Rab family GTPase [Candidatus Hodarchaeota archaeon]